MSKSTVNIFWFRRDLRWQDNTGLNQALASEVSVVPIFIFDREILDKLLRKDDARVTFMHLQLQRLQKELQLIGGELQVYHGTPLKIFKQLSNKYLIDTVFCNHDYEPYAKARDATVASLLERQGTKFRSFKDQVIFEKSEVVKPDGKPYTVFTPYMRKWKEKFHESGGLGELLNKEEPTANWHPDKG
ncbi:MAG: deoxyribodipyrimidine photo-lyase, partial [Cyclobacteriaceae bacterium]|nr:deoxyribodipyrimidine photo-lyase [Cyclobacteriaceae bacterium]